MPGRTRPSTTTWGFARTAQRTSVCRQRYISFSTLKFARIPDSLKYRSPTAPRASRAAAAYRAHASAAPARSPMAPTTKGTHEGLDLLLIRAPDRSEEARREGIPRVLGLRREIAVPARELSSLYDEGDELVHAGLDIRLRPTLRPVPRGDRDGAHASVGVRSRLSRHPCERQGHLPRRRGRRLISQELLQACLD